MHIILIYIIIMNKFFPNKFTNIPQQPEFNIIENPTIIDSRNRDRDLYPITNKFTLYYGNKLASGFSINDVITLLSSDFKIPNEVASLAFTGMVAIDIFALLFLCSLIINS